MRTARAIHERFMNPSGTILPRVGGGGGVGGGLGEKDPYQDQVDNLKVGAAILGLVQR